MSSRLQLRVSPGAATAGIVGRHGGAWKIRIPQPPERGKANAAVVRLLAKVLAIRPADVEIVSGHGSRDKTVELKGIDLAEIDRRLIQACAAGKDSE